MDIRIGIVQSMKEIEVELPEDAKRDKVMKEVEVALGSDQQRTAIEVKIVEAMQVVAQRPRVPA